MCCKTWIKHKDKTYMKILITGHTSGLGQALYNHFNSEGIHEVIGVSRSTGYEFPECYSRVLEIARTSDLFFNNTNYDYLQSEFIKDLKDQRSLMMVTSGSVAANYDFSDYCLHKRHVQETFFMHKPYWGNRCLLLRMGYLENRVGRFKAPPGIAPRDYYIIPVSYTHLTLPTIYSV